MPKKSKEQANVLEDNNRLALLPFGQEEVKPSAEWKTLRKQFKNNPNKWVETFGNHEDRMLMSFEVWCKITNYDWNSSKIGKGSYNGGQAFQKLMHLNLVDGEGAAHRKDYLETIEFDENGYDHADADEQTTEFHVSEDAGQRETIGMPLGSISGSTHPVKYTLGDSTDFGQKEFEASVVYYPASKVNWVSSWGMFQPLTAKKANAKGNRTHGSDKQFVTNGFMQGSTNDCNEALGTCVALGNQMCAIYGLYYYVGCEEPENNWVVTQTIDGVKYKIRMRMFNPAYKLQEGDLKIQEPLSKTAKQSETRMKFVGGEHILTPLCYYESRPNYHFPLNNAGNPLQASDLKEIKRNYAKSPAMQIVDKEKRTRIAPIANVNSFPKIMKYGKKYVLAADKLSNFLPNMHKPTEVVGGVKRETEGFVWGFQIPAALYLWPMLNLKSSEIQNKEVQGSIEAQWQPWPTWKKGFETDEQRINKREGTNANSYFDMLDFGEGWNSTDPFIRRRHALGLEIYTNVTTPMTVNVVSAAGPSGVDKTAEATYDPDPVLGTGSAETTNNNGVQGESDEVVAELAVGGSLGEELEVPREVLFEEEDMSDFKNRESCEPGAARRPVTKNADVNDHFKAARFHPWPHSQVYSEPKMSYKPGEILDANALKEYEKLYGSTHNLYLRGELRPTKIESINPSYGEPLRHNDQPILGMRLDTDDPVFRKNFCKIVAIFNDQSGLGYQGHNITIEQKQTGMLQGIWALKDVQEQTNKGKGKRKGKQYGDLNIQYTKPTRNSDDYICICRPVFTRKPPQSIRTFAEVRGDHDSVADEMVCVDESKYPNWWKNLSHMSVLEWVCSPWHYAYLPYQPHSMMFKDGETYSEGCTRCSRPFYEFEYMYKSYRYTPASVRSYPFKFYQVITHECGFGCAPVPFHDPRFWKETQTRAQLGAAAVQTPQDASAVASSQEETQDVERGGWHQWETFAFQLSQNASLQYEFEQIKSKDKLLKSGRKLEGLFTTDGKPLQPLTFQRYLNHMYSEERAKAYSSIAKSITSAATFTIENHWLRNQTEDKYLHIVNSKLSLTKNSGKFRFGQRKLMLQRGSKYGNLCRDCCNVLTFAPGLLQRANRVAVDTGMVLMAAKNKAKNLSTNWWTRLIEAQGKDVRGKLINFDLSIMHVRGDSDGEVVGREPGRLDNESKEDYKKRWEESMAIYLASLNKTHQVTKSLGNTTKYKSAPEFYLQKANFFPFDKRKYTDQSFADKKDSDLIARAVSSLRQVLEEGAGTLDVKANTGLRDIIEEVVHKYTHEHKLVRNDSIRVFDSEMMRLEIRNAKWEWNSQTNKGKWVLPVEHKRLEQTLKITGNEPKSTWHNCLIVRYWNPKSGAISTESATADDYVDRVYYATAKGVADTATCQEDETRPTMWCGDKFVTSYNEKEELWEPKFDASRNNQLVQWRKMNQSRLFITYSLHRAVRDEIEARVILEKMADAARTLFGNDENLAELLVFGYKLDAQTADTVSSGRMVVINAPNKKDKVPDFYGKGSSTSYLYDTYETHVEKVDCDGGIEIGPNRHHPHFHILLTINHWSYIQIDYFKMNAYLESMFKGQDPFKRGWNFLLPDSSGGMFYTDAEAPYTDIKLYPQDNWQDIIAAYVRKNATPGIFEAIRGRVGDI
jgi:hypothetical protein